MKSLIAILFSVLAGLFMFVGMIIIFKSKNNKKIESFSIALGLIVLLFLGLVHILPESIELLNNKFITLQSIAFIFLMSLVGYAFLKVLDKFMPDHNHSNSKKNLKHIAYVTSIALFLHNIVEGMSLYATTVASIKTGFIYLFGIGCHNVALGMTLTGQIYKEKTSKKETYKLIGFLVLANLIGALISYVFNVYFEKSFALGVVLSITFGMLVYIILYELIPSFRESKDKKEKVIGIVIGAILMLLTLLF